MSRPFPRPRPTTGTPPPHDDTADDDTADVEVAADAPRRTRKERRNRVARLNRIRRGQLFALGVATVAVVGAIVFVVVRPGQGDGASRAVDTAHLHDAGAVSAYLGAANPEIQVVTGIDYRSLDSALAAGLGVTTGRYRTSFRNALTGTGAEQRISGRVVQSFVPIASGVGTIDHGGDRAKVLFFGTQHTASSSGTTSNLVTLTATMQRHGSQYLISDLDEGANAGVPPGTHGLLVAAEAARSEVVNALTFRRADLAADERRALAGATGTLRGQLLAHAAATQAAVERGSYDLAGAVTALAVRSVARAKVTMLIAATGVRISSAGRQSAILDARYQVVVVRVDGTWLVSDIAPVSA